MANGKAASSTGPDDEFRQSDIKFLWEGLIEPPTVLMEWDEKLFALDDTGQLRYTVDEGVTWVMGEAKPE